MRTMFCLFGNIIFENYSPKMIIDIIKDIVFFGGFITFYKFIKSYEFNKKKEEINVSIKRQDQIEKYLCSYVQDEYKNNIRDISVRFIYCKNFPSNLENDGFKHMLYYDCYASNLHPSGFLDREGINFSFHPWFYGYSIYINKDDIFFIDKKSKLYKGFYELKGKYQIVQNLPYINIINSDFRNHIEYEPILYIKYKYTSKKLYGKQLFITSVMGEDKDPNFFYCKYFHRKNWINKHHNFKHFFLIFENFFKRIFKVKNRI